MKSATKHCLKALLPLIISLVILTWQLQLRKGPPPQRDDTEKLSVSMGICMRDTARFFYFFYYLGLLPVTSLVAPTDYSIEGAQAFVRDQGQQLSNDLDTGCAVGRGGDWGRFYLLLPNAWYTGSAENPSTILGSSLFFIGSLMILGISAARYLSLPFSLALVLLIGSSHFQLFETYHNNNVFSLPISVFALVLAATARLLNPKRSEPSRFDWFIALGLGVVLATVSQIRLESLPLMLSVILAFICSKQPIKRRLVLCLVFVLSLFGAIKLQDQYFAHKIGEANKFVTERGGSVKSGSALAHHPFWHPIAAGLGDFDRKYGYQMYDIPIFGKAMHVLNHRYGYNFIPKDWFYGDPKDPDAVVKPETLPEYEAALRYLVVGDISKDPLWYLGILKDRIFQIVKSFTPLRLDLGWRSFSLNFPPIILTFSLLLLAALRRWDYLVLVLFSLPMSVIPFLIHSKGGTTAYGVTHFICVAILVDISVGSVLSLIKKAICKSSHA